MTSWFFDMRAVAATALAFFAFVASAAHAQTQPQPGDALNLLNVLHLNASASVEATKDVLSVAFSTTKDGADAQAVQSALKQALDAALAEARKVAKPGQVDVQTGAFTLYPRSNSKGAMTGWQGSAELIVSGQDMQAVAQLTGRIQTLTIARVGQELSRESREKVEAEASEKAVAKFRARAAELAKQFGFSGFTLREVHVSVNDPQPGPMMRERFSAASADMALPTEAGKGLVTAQVNGSIQLK